MSRYWGTGSQAQQKKIEPIYIMLILSGHLHAEGTKLTVEPTHLKPSVNVSFEFIM